MISQSPLPGSKVVIDAGGLAEVLKNLTGYGYTLIGPKVEDSAIVYSEIQSLEELPQGWMDEQGPGFYRIKKTDDRHYFNYTVGPTSWKKYLHAPQQRLWQAERQGTSFRVIPEKASDTSYAFIGVRPCEIKAIEIQDRVFRGDHYTDPHYDQARRKSFIFAVNCGRANSTCFCTSMDSGPRAKNGFDLALTEFFMDDRHLFLIEVGSDKGSMILEGIAPEEADAQVLATCQKQTEETAAQITRRLNTDGLREALVDNPEHPRWAEVADRCLSCANCTMACPTCFCTTVEDTSDLTGDHAERWQRWDSCFTMDFSYIAGGNIRSSTKSRYRQWLTHKLSTWYNQFGSSGCVGCGRCITWCPVGIDITEEAAAIQTNPLSHEPIE
ncbi:MAG: 4Fe-4S dicluster domain-containing protein [Verrucomicrobia bacterium]|nr:4Fe-4S dicluster domain-containing protein [Verrucomicrobiota bacterium]MDA1067991.1 4Fe-4S dicluster domain-containing protein [Verrucomicrobiota bacterium]